MDNFIQEYFSSTWLEGNRTLDQYTYSGWDLAKKVNTDEWVLDVGCGTNPFKGKIKNLYGIDLTDVGSDEQVSIDHFEPARLFDVAFCLGSVNFHNEANVHNQIKRIVSMLTDNGRIYWRCNPGNYDHRNVACKELPIFPWTISHHEKWSKEFGFTLQNIQNDRNRIYAEWIR